MFYNRFDEAKKMMQSKLQSTANTVGVFLESETKIRTPVDTGHLRRSISHDTEVKQTKATVFIGSNVEYDPIVEFGLGGQPEQPHYRPAITENVRKIQEIIIKGMRV